MAKQNNQSKNGGTKEKFPRSVLIIIMVVTLGLVAIIGVSYAVFSSTNKGSDNTITAGTFTTTFTESNVISLTNGYPMTDAEGQALTPYTFTVTNTGSIAAKYDVGLEVTTGNTLPTSKIKYTIQQGTNAYTAPALLSTVSNNKFFTNQTLAAKASITFHLKLWIDNAAGTEINGQTYKAKVVVSAVQG